MSNVYARGEGKTFDHTPTNPRVAGNIEELDSTDNFVCVYMTNLAANEKGAVAVEGVFEMTKGSATDAWDIGDALAITVMALDGSVAASATGAHRAASKTINGDTTCLVKINCMN